jgi:hypothetical protein
MKILKYLDGTLLLVEKKNNSMYKWGLLFFFSIVLIFYSYINLDSIKNILNDGNSNNLGTIL